MAHPKSDEITLPSRRDPPVDSLAAIERRIFTTIGEDLARLRVRLDAAEARARQREHERAHEHERQSAIERAAQRWRMN
jgi:hypothetical protein